MWPRVVVATQALQPVGFRCAHQGQKREAEQAAEKVNYFVIPNEVRNLSLVYTREKRDSSAPARLGMTKYEFFRKP
jgi:hypothetical protein